MKNAKFQFESIETHSIEFYCEYFINSAKCPGLEKIPKSYFEIGKTFYWKRCVTRPERSGGGEGGFGLGRKKIKKTK